MSYARDLPAHANLLAMARSSETIFSHSAAISKRATGLVHGFSRLVSRPKSVVQSCRVR